MPSSLFPSEEAPGEAGDDATGDGEDGHPQGDPDPEEDAGQGPGGGGGGGGCEPLGRVQETGRKRRENRGMKRVLLVTSRCMDCIGLSSANILQYVTDCLSYHVTLV